MVDKDFDIAMNGPVILKKSLGSTLVFTFKGFPKKAMTMSLYFDIIRYCILIQTLEHS